MESKYQLDEELSDFSVQEKKSPAYLRISELLLKEAESDALREAGDIGVASKETIANSHHLSQVIDDTKFEDEN
jgi:hypothetical protein